MKPDTDNSRFPAHLLSSPIKVRKDYFFSKTIAHPRLKFAMQKTMDLIDKEVGPDILIVTGPTGVGKTTLAAKIENNILEMNMSRMETDKCFMPVARIDAIPPLRNTKFDWRDFYTRLLRIYREPCIRRKQLFEDFVYLEQPICPSYSMNSVSTLRQSVENTMKMRGTDVLIIDEANHMLMIEPKYMAQQFELIKSLSQLCGVTIILIGTYQLLQILEQSAQLVRRSRVVHMSRYDDYNEDDRLAFKAALNTFQRHMPFENEPDIVSHFDSFYLKSSGCVGILKRWLNVAVKAALIENKKTIDWKYADRFSHSNKSVRTIMEEAICGENMLRDIDLAELRKMLKNHHEFSNDNTPAISKTNDVPAKIKSIKSQVGKRNPKRDPTGRQSELGL